MYLHHINIYMFRADKSYIFSDRVVRIVWRRDWLTTNGTVEWPVNMMVTPRVTVSILL